MKDAKTILENYKGEGLSHRTVTGKGIHSKQVFSDLTNAIINDTSFNVKTYDKEGNSTDVNISELIRNDIKKTIDNAKYPQKSEIDVIDDVNIVTNGIATAIPHLVMEYIKCGKKFDFPNTPECVGGIYLAPVEGRVKDVTVRNMKTGDVIGTTTITTEDSIQLRAKSPVPQNLQTKLRKDLNGNVVQKFE